MAKRTKTVAERMADFLKLAQVEAKRAKNWLDLNNTLFGIGGPFAQAFPDQRERTAATRAAEFKEVTDLLDALPDPPVMPAGTMGNAAKTLDAYSGTFNVRLPKSIHAALVAEAEREGVSLNQLVLAKLAVQLRAVA